MIINDIVATGVIAVVRVDDITHAVPLAEALCAGGVTAVEFTLTSNGAYEAIGAVRKALPEAIVGVGSVITANQAKESITCGAQFVVSPVNKAAVIDACLAADVPVIPGAYSPSEIQAAWEAGADAVKVFPARALGAAFIKDVRAPLPHLKLIPTGGVSLDNAADYIAAGAAAVGVGSSLVKAAWVKAKNWSAISEQAKSLVAIVQAAR